MDDETLTSVRSGTGSRTSFDDRRVRPQQRAWLGLTRPLGLVEDTALLAAPERVRQGVPREPAAAADRRALSEELGRDIRVAVTVQTPGDETPADVDRSTTSSD